MHQSALILLLWGAVAHAQNCYTGSMPVTMAGSAKAVKKPVELVFASSAEYANALIVRDGNREYLTEFECTQGELADCALFDDGGTIRFKRKGAKNAQVSAGKLEVDTSEPEQPRIATVGTEATTTFTAMSASACSGEQARVRATFDRAEATAESAEPIGAPASSAPIAAPRPSPTPTPTVTPPTAPATKKSGNSPGSAR